MMILIDNGHGSNTPGKCSPDGKFREWAYTRDIALRVVNNLKRLGYDAERLVTEDTDVSLAERCKRVNDKCKQYGAGNVLLVSIHNNAAGADGQWHDARGWSAYVYAKAGVRSKQLAKCLNDEAQRHHLRGNRWIPTCGYLTANYYILRKTACAAVLTENLFQDNRTDVAFLESDEGKQAITDVHVDGIINLCKGLNR